MSNTTKKGLQWLNLMPEPYQSQARAAIEEQRLAVGVFFQIKFNSFNEFISKAFSWANSNVCETADESAQYWRNFKENPPEHLRD